jgi:hypothetical protein
MEGETWGECDGVEWSGLSGLVRWSALSGGIVARSASACWLLLLGWKNLTRVHDVIRINGLLDGAHYGYGFAVFGGPGIAFVKADACSPELRVTKSRSSTRTLRGSLAQIR